MEGRGDFSYTKYFSNLFTLKEGAGHFYSPAYLETPAKYMQVTFQESVGSSA